MAPALRSKTARPLEGVRILDLSWVWSGPYTCMLLAQLGAEVIRVESSSRPCMLRGLPPFPDGKRPSPQVGTGFFAQCNLGKRSVSLNLKHPEALAAAKRLAARSDAVVCNYAAGVLERMGLGYEALRAVKEDVIFLCMGGFGETGPFRNFVAYGQGQATMSGFARLLGPAGSPPRNSGFMVTDPFVGVHGAFAVLAALRHRRRTGEGQFIDMSQWEATLQLMGGGILDRQLSGEEPYNDANRHARMAPHGVFRCADAPGTPGKPLDMWVSIAVADEAQWRRLCAAMERPALAEDARFCSLAARKQNEDALEAIVSQWTRPQAGMAIARKLQATGIAAFPCSTQRDVYQDEGLEARAFFEEFDHPAYGRRTYPGAPWRIDGVRPQHGRAAPILGQHTEEVLKEIGYSDAQIEAMRQADALT